MQLLPGFAWPVPRAFASAVAACRFEQGDLLYDDAAVYGDARWEVASKGLGRHIAVLDPPRSARSAPADAQGNRFLANWEAPVGFELHDYRDGQSDERRSTQGRLFTCLWRGDVGVLDPESGDPTPPRGARELHAELESALPACLGALEAGSPEIVYMSVVDASSEASRAKALAVEARLAATASVRSRDLSPVDAGLPGSGDFHPALTLRCLAVRGASEGAVRDLLKAALYAPSRAAADEEGSRPDRFRLERHGLLATA